MRYVGIDWGEQQHAVCVLDTEGQILVARAVSATHAGVTALLALLAAQDASPEEIVIGIETDHGLLVTAVVAAGYPIYALNPHAVTHYRPRYGTSGKKSDSGDARMLAEVIRTDRQHHRRLIPDSVSASALQVLTRAHQRLVQDRGRQCNELRAALLAYYPAALATFGDLSAPVTLTVLAAAPTPEAGRRLTVSQLQRFLRRAGRTRDITAAAEAIQLTLRSEQLAQHQTVTAAYGAAVAALVAVITAQTAEIATLEAELTRQFEAHPDAKIIGSLPGLGALLGARVLAEFGDAPNRYRDSKARKCYAGTAPVTRASGLTRQVSRRHATNTRLQTACLRWAFCSLTQSPGARVYYDELRDRGKTHQVALRALANRWVGILHGCLRHQQRYDETTAWPRLERVDEPATPQDKSLKMIGAPHGSTPTVTASA